MCWARQIANDLQAIFRASVFNQRRCCVELKSAAKIPQHKTSGPFHVQQNRWNEFIELVKAISDESFTAVKST